MHVVWLQLGGLRTSYSTFEAELADVIPVVKGSIVGTRIIGCLCAGNKNGFCFCLTILQIKVSSMKKKVTKKHKESKSVNDILKFFDELTFRATSKTEDGAARSNVEVRDKFKNVVEETSQIWYMKLYS